MKSQGQSRQSIKTQTKVNKDKPSTDNRNNSHTERIQSVSSDVFTPGVEIDENNFEFPNNKHKRLLSSPKSDTQEHKKNKPMFVTANRYSSLTIDDNIIESSVTHTDNTSNIEVDQPAKIKLPPPIFIRGILDFVGFRNQLIDLIGPDNFIFKSSTNNLKVQTTQPEFYRKIINFLKEKNAQYHTYQPLGDKPFRVVVRNLHPLTPTVEIGIAIEEIGFSVRQITNVIQKTTKNNLPMFFVDLEPAAINNDIFNVTSLLHTKIKIEETHKRRDILQCHNCQDYGHSKKYCSYSPRCVRCGEDHPSTHCTKTKDLPAKCALCKGNHPANYKGCQTYKSLQQLQKPTSKKNSNFTSNDVSNNVNYDNNTNVEATHQHTSNTNIPPKSFKSYAQAASPNNSSPTPNNSINDSTLLNFLNEFKLLINPLLSLLTTVLDSLPTKCQLTHSHRNL